MKTVDLKKAILQRVPTFFKDMVHRIARRVKREQ